MPKTLKPKKRENSRPTIAIIGFGRFGQFWTKALAPLAKIIVISDHATSAEVQKAGGRLVPLAEINQADLVFVAVAISDTEAQIKKIAPLVKAGAVVMDVCSVKVEPANWLKKYLPNTVFSVATHPMFGPDSGQHGVAGLQIVVCPVFIDGEKYNQVLTLFKKLKLNIVECSPAEHDRQTAYSLALVHYLGRVLGRLPIEPITIATLGFNRLLEIRRNVLKDSYQLFSDFYRYNPYAKKALLKFKQAAAIVDKGVIRK